MKRWLSGSEEETRALGERLAAELAPDGVLLLDGDLGAGKTVLVRGVAEGLGLDPREVQSPSYTLMREHGTGRRRLVHVDLYRLEAADVEAVGLEERLAGAGVKVVEWAERLPFPVAGALRLRIRRTGEAGRREIVEVDEPEPARAVPAVKGGEPR